MERAVELSKEKYCSVSAMLEKTAKIEFVIEYDEVVGSRRSGPRSASRDSAQVQASG